MKQKITHKEAGKEISNSLEEKKSISMEYYFEHFVHEVKFVSSQIPILFTSWNLRTFQPHSVYSSIPQTHQTECIQFSSNSGLSENKQIPFLVCLRQNFHIQLFTVFSIIS